MIYYNTSTYEVRLFDSASLLRAIETGESWLPRPEMPAYDASKELEPFWSLDKWVKRDKTTEDLAAEYRARFPDAEAYQVRAWMIRSGFSPESIPSMIAAAVPEGPQRDEALMRWEFAVRVPKDHPLVAVVAGGLKVSVDSVWWEILAL